MEMLVYGFAHILFLVIGFIILTIIFKVWDFFYDHSPLEIWCMFKGLFKMPKFIKKIVNKFKRTSKNNNHIKVPNPTILIIQ